MRDPGWQMLAEELEHFPARTIDEALRKQAAAIPNAPFIKYTEDGVHFDTYSYSGMLNFCTCTAPKNDADLAV